MNRFELQQLAAMRLSDAKALLETGDNDAGAYYMVGYAVECALKAVIAKNQGEYPYPDFGDPTFKKESYFTHNIKSLIAVARIKDDLDIERRNNQSLEENWATVERWNEQSRYEITRNSTETCELVVAIADPQDGVLSWLKQIW
ncbi:MAG: HEPN domain-containing protein [Armatimonadetes bacterium]|nr:HEPN domain-containing protein [Armatimonadota bacterium]